MFLECNFDGKPLKMITRMMVDTKPQTSSTWFISYLINECHARVKIQQLNPPK